MVNIPTLKGVHYAIESGRLAAEAAFASLKAGVKPGAGLESYDDAVRSSFIGKDLHEVRDMRHVFGRGFFVGAACAGAMAMSKGRINVGKMRTQPDDHVTIATIANNLGVVNDSLERVDAAAKYYGIAHDHILRAFGPAHPSTRAVAVPFSGEQCTPLTQEN